MVQFILIWASCGLQLIIYVRLCNLLSVYVRDVLILDLYY